MDNIEEQIVMMSSSLKRINLEVVCSWFPKYTKAEIIENVEASERLELKDNVVHLKKGVEIPRPRRLWM